MEPENHMPTHPRRLLAPAALITLLLLTGCTSSDEPTAPADADGSPSAGQEQSPEAASSADSAAFTTSAVLAEQTFDVTTRSDDVGGTITTTLRALEVKGDAMTLRWALRWDNDDAPDDEAVSLFKLGLAQSNSPVLTDPVNLKQYRSLCTEGSWQGDRAGQETCARTALVSPSDSLFLNIPNHTTVEAWAVLPAPEDDDAVFEVLVADGWPAFSGVQPTPAP